MRLKTGSGYQDDVARVQSRLAIEAEMRGAHVISLYGLSRGAGVTTVAASVAAGLASQSLPTILVDADATSPAVHRVFRLQQTPGVADVLSSATQPAGALRQTNVPNLNVVTAGNWAESAATMLPDRWKKMFAAFRDLRGMVIVDAGKTGSVHSDAIAHASDGVVLIVEEGKSTREQVADFAAHMEEIGVPLFGVVLNKRRRLPRSLG